MKYFILTFTILSVLTVQAMADAFNPEDIKSYKVTIGALAVAPLPRHGFIFRSGTTEAFFDFSANSLALVSSPATPFEAIPGLQEIGCKMDNGKEYDWVNGHKEPPGVVNDRMLRENPHGNRISTIFWGYTGNRIEVYTDHPTRVVRIEFSVPYVVRGFDGDVETLLQKIDLWSQLDEKTPDNVEIKSLMKAKKKSGD